MADAGFALALPPGLVSDDSAFHSRGRWADGDGFRFRHSMPETIGGAVEMANSTAMDRVDKMLVFDEAGTISLAVAGTALFVGPPDAPATDITPASGWPADGSARHCLAMWGDRLLASVSGGKLFESAGGGQATEIVNAPDRITAMLVTPSRQVMALGCNEEASGIFNGRCLRWSDIEDHEDWTTSAANNAGEHILPGQADVVAACILGDNVVIWTESDLWVGQYIGDPGQTFIFTRVGDIGISGLDAWAIYRQTVYWMGPDRGVYAYQLGGAVQRIPCPVSSDFLWRSTSWDNGRIFACTVPRYGEIWFSVPVGSNVPDQYFVYCVDESMAAQAPVWFKGTYDLAGLIASPGAMIDSPLLQDALVPNQTTAIVHPVGTTGKPVRWDCAASSISPSFGIAGAFIQTAEFYVDRAQRRLMLRSICPDFDEQGGAVYLTVQARDRPLAEPVVKGPYTVATSVMLASAIVDGIVVSGATSVLVDWGAPEAMAAGVRFNFLDVNAWDGGDTGVLKEFTVASDFVGGVGMLFFTPPVIDSGPDRNVVTLPKNNTRVAALTRASKKDFRASGRVMAFRFTAAGAFRIRFGRPVFDAVVCGGR